MKYYKRKYFGTMAMPRLRVTVTSKHIYAQLIDDEKGETLVSASTLDKEFGKDKKLRANIKNAKLIGSLIAKRALEKKVSKIIFDRGPHRYHGRIKSLADAAREAGLRF